MILPTLALPHLRNGVVRDITHLILIAHLRTLIMGSVVSVVCREEFSSKGHRKHRNIPRQLSWLFIWSTAISHQRASKSIVCERRNEGPWVKRYRPGAELLIVAPLWYAPSVIPKNQKKQQHFNGSTWIGGLVSAIVYICGHSPEICTKADLYCYN